MGLSVTFPFFLGAGDKNLFLVAVMSVSPFLFFMERRQLDVIDFWFILMLFLMLGVCLMHFDSFRPLSFLYTVGFVFSFLFLRSMILHERLTSTFFITILRYLIYVYGIVLIFQQLCVLVGMDPIFGRGVSIENKWKLPSLTPEPSHLARFDFFVMYAYLILREKEDGRMYTLDDAKNEKMLWFLYFWTMLTCVSTTAYLFVFLIFVRYIKFSVKTLVKYLLAFVVVGSFLFYLFADLEAFQRVFNIIPVLFSLSPEEINVVDHSAAHRIVPIFVLFNWINPYESSFWLGNGMDYGLSMNQSFMYESSGDSTYAQGDANVGGVTNAFVDFGMITMSILIFSLLKLFKDVPDKFFVWMWFFVNIFSAINTQFFWFSMLLVYATSAFQYQTTEN